MRIYGRIIRAFYACLFLYIPVLHAEIKIGISYYNPPFVFNTKQGLDIDLMNEICQKTLGQCTFVQLKYADLFSALRNKQIDLAIGALSITDEKLHEFYFSMPYLLNRGQFLIADTNNAKSINDLHGQKVGVFQGDKNGTLYSGYLQSNYANQFQTIPYDNVNKMIADFQNKALDALFVNEDSALYWVHNSFGKLKLLGPPADLGSGLAIVALPENKKLIQQINMVLEEIENNGDYLRLYRTYIQSSWNYIQNWNAVFSV